MAETKTKLAPRRGAVHAIPESLAAPRSISTGPALWVLLEEIAESKNLSISALIRIILFGWIFTDCGLWIKDTEAPPGPSSTARHDLLRVDGEQWDFSTHGAPAVRIVTTPGEQIQLEREYRRSI